MWREADGLLPQCLLGLMHGEGKITKNICAKMRKENSLRLQAL